MAATETKLNMESFRQKLSRLLTPSTSSSTTPTPKAPAHFPLRRWLFIVTGALLTAVALWVFRGPVWELLSLVGDQTAVSEYLKSYGAWGPLVLAAAQLIQVLVAFIPGHVFLVAAGYVYGFWPALILNMVCIVAASQLGFALARWTGRPLVERLVDKDLLDRWYRIGEKQGFLFFSIAFVLPAFPTDAMNYVGGLSGISGIKFLGASILGRLPSAIMLTMIGAYGLEFGRATWFGIGVLAVTVLIVGRIIVARIEARHATADDSPTDVGSADEQEDEDPA
ncbi:MAG: TVP38/TMEM64 family protein [Ardenticatenaceae bacterium]|nr:TVP38/TMEM64 family protein [Ardenticatenaceae bacterium]